MCTQAVKRVNDTWYLMKTRDPVSWMRYEDEIALFDKPQDKYRKLIIQNPVPYEDGYYGGINDQGVAFISTFVRTSEDQVSYIRKPYIRLVLDAENVEEAIKIISEKIKKAQGDKHKVVEEVQIIEEVAELPKKGFFRRLFGR